MSASLAELEAMIAADEAAMNVPEVESEPVQETPVAPPITATFENLQEMIEEDEASYPGAGVIEPAITMATGFAGEVLGGLAGGVQSVNPLAGDASVYGSGVDAYRATQDALTVLPKSTEGKEGLKTLGDFIESGLTEFNKYSSLALGQFAQQHGADAESAARVQEDAQSMLEAGISEPLGMFVFEATDSDLAGSLAYASPEILMTALGLSSLKSLRPGTQLLDAEGNPTNALEVALDEHGLVFDNLTDEAKAAIPEYASPKLLPSPKSENLNVAEDALKKQIQSGGRDDSLATITLEKDKVKVDKLGEEAIKQGFKRGFVQSVKTANPETKKIMLKMLKQMRQIKSNTRKGLDFRPSDEIGDSLTKRLKFIRGKADDAREELNQIAKNQLPGKKLDPEPIIQQFEKTLADLDIELTAGPDGVPVANYKGSMIQKDSTSQNIINDAIDLLAEGGAGEAPDALRFHKLKRQLDNMIDFRKKSIGGLTEAGRGVLKDLRASLNEALRAANPRYAEVNDVLSQSLKAFDIMQEAVGPSIDIFGASAKASLGQDMRGLMSNRKKRVQLDDSVVLMDDTARALGGEFKEDIKDLALFSHNLDNRFGPVAESGFKSEVSSGVENALRNRPEEVVRDYVAGKVVDNVEKLRGVNDFNAFKSIEELLKRPAQ